MRVASEAKQEFERIEYDRVEQAERSVLRRERRESE